MRTCNNLDWKGGVLKVQPAKESHLQAVQNEIAVKGSSSAESKNSKKRGQKIKPEEKEESSDESDGEPQSKLGVPAWKGFRAKTGASQPSPSATQRDAKIFEKNPGVQQASPSSSSLPTLHKRLYIGGLPESALDGDLKTKFAEFGTVKSVEIKCKENYGSRRFFAYIDLDTDESRLGRCKYDDHCFRGYSTCFLWFINFCGSLFFS